MTTHKLSNNVTDLVATATSLSSVDLVWSAPISFAPKILGYNVNFTTPIGDPLTVIINHTGSTATAYTVTNIAVGSPVSFRVAAVTAHGINATGNISNATVFSSFTIGQLSINTEPNTAILDVLFERIDLGNNSTLLDVRYPNTVTDFRCDFTYKFARINQTFTGLTSTPFDANFDNSSFKFDGLSNEIITAFCWDNDNINTNGTFNFYKIILFTQLKEIYENRDTCAYNSYYNK